jgi:translocation and assembly module TamA
MKRRAYSSLVLGLVLTALGAPAVAAIRIDLAGVDGDVRTNVLAYLSVERYRQRDDVDQDTMNRLFNRIDGEVKSALRPYGYYDPKVEADFKPNGSNWTVTVRVVPGDPVRIRAINLKIDGPGENDPAFLPILSQRLLRNGARLNHGNYEEVKGDLTRLAAANGYLTARLVKNQMLVDTKALSAQIDLHLETGPRFNFGAVSIEQNIIRPDLMRRFLRFQEGTPYNASELLRTQFALDDSLYFSSVDVAPGAPDTATLTVPIHITATRNLQQFTYGAGYGTDTAIRGTLGWTNSLLNDRGHRLRFELKASTITRRLDARYDIPIGDPALERFSVEALNRQEKISDLDTNETTIRPSVTRVRGRWQTVTSVSATHTRTNEGQGGFSNTLLVPGIVFASVPDGFLGESLFSRTFYAELIGSQAALGSDANFLRLLLQSERQFELKRRWHLLVRGEFGTSLVDDFGDIPGIYRFFAGGDRSVRGFAYNSLSPEELITLANGKTELRNTGGKHMIVGSVELVHDLPKNLGVAAFFDFGNAFNNFGDKLEYAGGMGLRYRLPVVSIGLDVAKPMSTGGNWRIHLNITPKL